MSVNTQETSGYLFDAAGQPHGSCEKIRDIGVLEEITGFTQFFRRKIVQCNFAHEKRIAPSISETEFQKLLKLRKSHKQDADQLYQERVLSCLCPKHIRRSRPICAHASSLLEPDPYGFQIRRLEEHNVLLKKSWRG